MKRRMRLGEFVTAYIGKLGVSHLFGIAGDLALKLGEPRPALEAAHAAKTFAIIDVRVGVDALSPMSIKYIKAAAKRSRTPNESNGGRAAARI